MKRLKGVDFRGPQILRWREKENVRKLKIEVEGRRLMEEKEEGKKRLTSGKSRRQDVQGTPIQQKLNCESVSKNDVEKKEKNRHRRFFGGWESKKADTA